MSLESLKIIELLEQGKLTPEQAAQLLEQLKKPDAPYVMNMEANVFQDHLNEFAKNVECFAKDISEKTGSCFKEMEPKLKKATKVVVSRTASVIDDLSKVLNDAIKNLDESLNKCEDEKCCEEEKCCCDEEPVSNGPRPDDSANQ